MFDTQLRKSVARTIPVAARTIDGKNCCYIVYISCHLLIKRTNILVREYTKRFNTKLSKSVAGSSNH